MLTNAIIDAKLSKRVLVRMTVHEELGITVMLSALPCGRIQMPFVILTEKLPGGIICVCIEKGWMTEEHVLKWLTEAWDRRPGDKTW